MHGPLVRLMVKELYTVIRGDFELRDDFEQNSQNYLLSNNYLHVVRLNVYYITSAASSFNVSFPIIFDFLIIPESIQSFLETVHRLSLDYCIW